MKTISVKGLNENLINFAKSIYNKIPVGLLNFFAPIFWAIPARIRYGNTFVNTWDMLEKEEFHTREEFDELVDRNFMQIIQICYEKVPYYREMMDKLSLTPDSFRGGVKNIEKLPFLNKDIILEQGLNLVNCDIKRKDMVIKHTSGSTGYPKTLYFDKGTALREWANVLHLWKRVGYEWGSSRLVMCDFHFRAIDKGQHYQWDAMRRDLLVDIHDMTDQNCEIYCRQVEKHKPEFIYGYASAVFQLCEYINKRKLNHQFKAALLISETISDAIREYIQKVLNVRVYSFYGSSERAAIAGECERYTHYHVEPTYGYVEIIDENGEVIEDDRPGEIVVTGFTNTVMPLLRYRIGDVGQWDTETKCDCGRYHKILKYVNGRTSDFLYDRDGVKKGITAIRTSDITEHHVLEYQFVQNEIGKVQLHIIADTAFSQQDEEKLLNLLKEDTAQKINFKIVKCEQLQRESNGKKRQVIQKIQNGAG